MAKRTKYPKPDCPRCGHKTSWVKNTYYTSDGRIIRYRMCDDCEWRWCTLQYPEATIDITNYLVRIPKWGDSSVNSKQIEIIPLKDSL